MFEDVIVNELCDGEGWLLLSICFLCRAFQLLFDGTLNPPVETQRMNWMFHKERMISRGHFRRMHRMDPPAFDKLVPLLDATLKSNANKAFNRSPAGPTTTEIRLHCLLRCLAGGSHLDICALVSIPHSTFCGILWQTCDAVCQCPEMELMFPTTPEQLEAASLGMESISFSGIMSGCIGVIDGWLCPIEVPTSTVVGDVRSHFSGHCQRCGFNTQAVTDHLGRFIFMAVAAPGGQGDINALARTSLTAISSKLPLRHFISTGDNARAPSEHLVPVFGGIDRRDIHNDNANFHFSQCRIRSEMAFGIMTNRFGVLQRPLRVSPPRTGKLVQTIARLHNFCLTENNDHDAMTQGAVQPSRQEEIGLETNGDQPIAAPGVSCLRESLAKRAKDAGLCRA